MHLRYRGGLAVPWIPFLLIVTVLIVVVVIVMLTFIIIVRNPLGSSFARFEFKLEPEVGCRKHWLTCEIHSYTLN